MERAGLVGIAEVLDPRGVHLRVAPAPGDEVLVRAELGDATVVDDRGSVGAHRGRQPVGNEDSGTGQQQCVEAGQ